MQSIGQQRIRRRLAPGLGDTAERVLDTGSVLGGKHAYFLPVVDSASCTGCGKCESACIILESAIKVLPLDVAKGRLGEHYRFGWTEEARISRDFEAPKNAPDVPGWGEAGLRKVLESMDDLSGIEEP